MNASDMTADAKNAVSMLLKNMLPAQEDMEQPAADGNGRSISVRNRDGYAG